MERRSEAVVRRRISGPRPRLIERCVCVIWLSVGATCLKTGTYLRLERVLAGDYSVPFNGTSVAVYVCGWPQRICAVLCGSAFRIG